MPHTAISEPSPEHAEDQASLMETTQDRHEEALERPCAPLCAADSEHSNDDRVIAHSAGKEVCGFWEFGGAVVRTASEQKRRSLACRCQRNHCLRLLILAEPILRSSKKRGSNESADPQPISAIFHHLYVLPLFGSRTLPPVHRSPSFLRSQRIRSPIAGLSLNSPSQRTHRGSGY